MTELTTRHGRYLSDFTAFEAGLSPNGARWLEPLRRRAMSRFAEVGMPTARRGNERWKYTDVGPIARTDFVHARNGLYSSAAAIDPRTAAAWDDGWTTLVFVNGHYAEGFSCLPAPSGGVVAGNLADAAASRREVVERHLARYAALDDDDGFAALNTAFLQDGAFVQIPAGRVLSQPVHLVFIAAPDGRPGVSYPRVLVVAGAGSEATLIESYVSLSAEPYFTDTVAELVLEEGAHLDHYRIMTEGERAFHIGTTRVYQGRDSNFSSVSFAHGARIGRNDVHVLLDAPGGECTLNGLYMTDGETHLDNHISVTHSKPHATSQQYYKGILTDGSRAVFSGVVLVEKDAQKTYATQKDMNLLLSDGAEVDTKPSLLIYADDVKCFHGAAAGELDENALFYMQSRGLDRATAGSMLIRAFASEITEMLRPDALRMHIEQLTTALIPRFRFQARG